MLSKEEIDSFYESIDEREFERSHIKLFDAVSKELISDCKGETIREELGKLYDVGYRIESLDKNRSIVTSIYEISIYLKQYTTTNMNYNADICACNILHLKCEYPDCMHCVLILNDSVNKSITELRK